MTLLGLEVSVAILAPNALGWPTNALTDARRVVGNGNEGVGLRVRVELVRFSVTETVKVT